MTQALPPGCRPIRNTDGACAVIPGYCARADGMVFRLRPRGDWVPLGAFFHNQTSMVIRVRLPGGRYRDLSLGRVICRAFHGPRPLGHDVFYWPDDDRRNCRADNLRWAPRGTSKLGTLIRRRHNTPPGEGNPQAVLVERTVRWMRREYRRGRTSQSLAREAGVSETAARRAITGRTWSHIGGAVKMRPRGAPAGNTNRAAKKPPCSEAQGPG